MTVLPLTLLRAFECAARLGSLSAAARELGVTHAAVAQNVRKLEKELGHPLLVRKGAGMATTAVGEVLAKTLGDGFATLAQGVQAVRDLTQDRPITLSCTPTFAEHWLMPRLADFWSKHPDIQVSVTPSTQLVDLVRDGIDVAIRHGQGPWPGVDATPLVAADALIVGLPSFSIGVALQQGPMSQAKATALKNLPWVLDQTYGEYNRWVEALGIQLDQVDKRVFPTNSLVNAAMREGMGISVQPRSLVGRDLREGNLIVLHEDADGQAPQNWLITQQTPHRDDLKMFLGWMRRQAKEP